MFSGQLHRFLHRMAQTMYFRPRTTFLRVGTMGDVMWGKYAIKLTETGVNMHSEVNTPKYVHECL